jgi:hypothetical protein
VKCKYTLHYTAFPGRKGRYELNTGRQSCTQPIYRKSVDTFLNHFHLLLISQLCSL